VGSTITPRLCIGAYGFPGGRAETVFSPSTRAGRSWISLPPGPAGGVPATRVAGSVPRAALTRTSDRDAGASRWARCCLGSCALSVLRVRPRDERRHQSRLLGTRLVAGLQTPTMARHAASAPVPSGVSGIPCFGEADAGPSIENAAHQSCTGLIAGRRPRKSNSSIILYSTPSGLPSDESFCRRHMQSWETRYL